MTAPGDVPELRVRAAVPGAPRDDGRYVLYWMIGARRLEDNYALERAVDWARELEVPLVIFEPLSVDYRWASDRIHSFVLDGMREHAEALAGGPALYLPYVEPEPGAGGGLLHVLAADAALVVTDEALAGTLPRMIAAATRDLPAPLEVVDSNGLLPLRAADRAYPTAYAFRRHLQRVLPEHLARPPAHAPLEDVALVPFEGEAPSLAAHGGDARERLGREGASAVEDLPLDHDVPPVDERGGARAAHEELAAFAADRLERYGERNDPASAPTSRLSAHLHFGHIGPHAVLREVTRGHGWSPADLEAGGKGAREGWWGLPPAVEGYLDQLVTWRELGAGVVHHDPEAKSFAGLPDWARATLDEHRGDPRPETYTLEELEAAETEDPIWNAAQRELRREGRIHNYLRMLWGKKVLQWSPEPEEAWDTLFALNDRWALDGRDPNSVSGIAWVFGRHDRPFGPERPIFGKVRYMTSENTARKFKLQPYLERYGAAEPSLFEG